MKWVIFIFHPSISRFNLFLFFLQKEKTSEMERRELGKNLAEMKKKREEDEIRQAAEERRQAKV